MKFPIIYDQWSRWALPHYKLAFLCIYPSRRRQLRSSFQTRQFSAQPAVRLLLFSVVCNVYLYPRVTQKAVLTYLSSSSSSVFNILVMYISKFNGGNILVKDSGLLRVLASGSLSWHCRLLLLFSTEPWSSEYPADREVDWTLTLLLRSDREEASLNFM